MSIPSSRLEVATMAGSRPRLRRSSIAARLSLATEPWCASASSSPARSFRAAARRSARRRLFTKTMVERCARISSTRRGCRLGQIDGRRGGWLALPSGSSWSDQGAPSSSEGSGWASAAPPAGAPSGAWAARRAMSSTGTSMVSSTARREPASAMTTGRGVQPTRPSGRPTSPPPSRRAASSAGRWVADRPMRWSEPVRPGRASRRSRESARCAPRLVGTMLWISSTITVSTPARIERAREVSSR